MLPLFNVLCGQCHAFNEARQRFGVSLSGSLKGPPTEESMAFLRLPEGHWVVGSEGPCWHESRPVGRPSFYAPDFFLEDAAPWLTFDRLERLTDAEWQRRYCGRTAVGPLFQEPDRLSFVRRTEAILRAIAAGQIAKAVPVVFAMADAAEVDWGALRPTPPSTGGLTPYGFVLPDEAMIGVTPEVLIRLRGLCVDTMAVAGTGERGGPSLLGNPKEVLEHQLVIGDIRAQLEPLGKVSVGTTEERVFPHLKHLFTPIHVDLKESTPIETLVARLHPTAALGGFPREAARRWLRAQPEASVRRRFGAPFGYVEGDSGFFVVAIRGLQKHSGRLWLGSGCGIVSGSRPEAEWDELRLKRRSACRQLGLDA